MDEKSESMIEVRMIITPMLLKNTYLERHCEAETSRLISSYPFFNWDIVTEMDLSFLNITHIDNLSLIANVTHLKMTQNYIERIQNLEKLQKLENLDLGFNKITKIENLEHLTELRNLNLQGNKISKLENLDGNSKLQLFIVNNNQISDINEIFYMKRFKNLRFLEVSNNPLGNNYKSIIIDQFPNLMFIDFKKITDVERPRDKLLNDVSSLPEPKSAKNPYFNIYRDSFLIQTDGPCFTSFLFKEDNDGILFRKWNSTVIMAFEEFQKEMTTHAMDLFNTNLKRYKIALYKK